MKTTIAFAMMFASFALGQPLAGDSPQQMCLCEFVAPTYPPIARSARVQGTVLVIMKVHDDGTVAEIWPPGTEMTPQGPVTGMSTQGMQNILAGGPFEVVKKWKFCAGGSDRYVPITFDFKLTEPGAEGWAPTHVSFHAPANVEITTARLERIDRSDKK
jgi:hypothetical protein